MALFGDVTGYIDTGRAAKSISDANIAAEHGVLGATSAATAGITGAVNNADTSVNAAGQTAIQGVQDATTGANSTIDAAHTAGNQTLGNILGGEQSNLSPYLQAGAQGVSSLADYADSKPQFHAPTAEEVQNTPGFQFQLQQGSNAITNQAAANGLSQGGNTLKALTQYGQNLAGTYYQNAFNNAQQGFQTNQNATLANLSALTGAGQIATGQSNAAVQNAGNQIASNEVQSGNLRAGNTMQSGYYAGQTGTSLAQYLASLGLQGAENAGALSLKGAQSAGDYAVGAGQAHAGGILGQGKALTQGVQDLAGLFMGGGG
jgi:hypothetical protein